jgi:hypothetical protein
MVIISEDRDRDTKFKQLKDLLKDGTIYAIEEVVQDEEVVVAVVVDDGKYS